MEFELSGGVANAGAVVRSGDHVLRPSSKHTATIHRFLQFLKGEGFDGACVPIGVDPDGRERLHYIHGEVPVPPYPEWAQSDAVLASVAALVRRYHDTAAAFTRRTEDNWNHELADPNGGALICHNDVCLENVVFRDGEAVGLLDFEFAAPGSALYDLACFARMCVPLDDEASVRLGWRPCDQPGRLRLVADTYGLEPHQRRALLVELDGVIARGGLFVKSRVDAGERPFVEMWNAMGGMAAFDRRRAWWAAARADFVDALR